MSCFLALLLSFSSLQVDVSIAEGSREETPTSYTSITEFERLAIRTPYWARVRLDLPSDENYILTGGNPNMQRISFYDGNGRLLKTGNHIKFLNGSDSPRTFFLFYPFVDEKDKNLLSINVYEELDFVKKTNAERSTQLVFQSILLFPLMGALFFAVFTQKWVYGYYALYIVAIMLFFGYQYGLLGDLIDFVNDIPPIWIWFHSFINSVFYLLFSSEYLDLKKHDRFSLKLIRIAIGFIFFFFLVSVSLYLAGIDVQQSLGYKLPFILVESALVIWFFSRIIKNPNRIKIFYIVGFIILISIAIFGQLVSTSQSAPDYNHIFQAGLVFEVFILALGLGTRVNEIQKAELNTQQALIHQLQVNEKLQEEYATKLEQTVQKRTQELLHRNAAYELLLKEVHHRVKNNLQMIVSILNMHHRRVESKEVEAIFINTKNKIKSLAILHEFIYQSNDLSSISLKEYLTKLSSIVIDSFGKKNNVELALRIANVETCIDTGISIGLIVNELLTNCLKYGIEGASNLQISVELEKNNEVLHLKIADSGKGFDEGKVEFGLGYTIIRSILENHEGSLQFQQSEKEFTVSMTFKDI